MKRITKRPSVWLVAALLATFVPAGCLFSGHKKAKASNPTASVAPDKILYNRALDDYKHGRYTEARLSLQALINSYPDSEYLAKAKLAVADSYYKEGGTEGLTQAVAEYKDFITFFPFLDEAAYAQMQVAMAHYRMMEKPDRDATQARLAEVEFQRFLLKYPKSPLVPVAEQRLRDVQEVLAGGDFDVAHFYYVKGDYRAAAARLIEVTNRYPLFSQSDRALWMLGDIYQRAARGSKNEQQRSVWRTQADKEYAQIVKEYPLSPLAVDAKRKLTQDSVAIPAPDPQALADERYDEKFAREHRGVIHRAMGVIKSSPDVSMAARAGTPDLNPPGEIESPQNVFQTATASNVGADASGGGSTGESMSIQAVSPASSTPPPTANSAAAPTDPAGAAGATSPAATSTAATTQTLTDVEAEHVTAASVATDKSNAKKKKQKPAVAAKLNKHHESSSKRKKGLKKLIPW